MAALPKENVLVVPAQLLHEIGYFQGFTREVGSYMEAVLDPRNTSYRPRDEMETDPRFKQLIPYVIFHHDDGSQHGSLFQYTRGSGQGEQRLHSKRSIGVGGHICCHDARTLNGNSYQEGMRRELEEEVLIQAPYRQRLVGLINDDQTEVGQVHLGVVHILEMEAPAVSPREEDLVDGGFRPVDQLLAQLEDFETWSQICLESLFSVRT